MCFNVLQKTPFEAALQQTTSSVFEILGRAHRRNADELMLETDANALTRPMAMVQMRNLYTKSRLSVRDHLS